LIGEGPTSDEIAEQLFISKKTSTATRPNKLEKLSMCNRVELTRYAIRGGLSRSLRPLVALGAARNHDQRRLRQPDQSIGNAPEQHRTPWSVPPRAHHKQVQLA
jgi:hypothetical protein